jgi:hypothetical protein
LISSKKIYSDYRKFIKYSESALLSGNLEHSLRFISSAASLAYYYNLFYFEDKIECLVKKVSLEIGFIKKYSALEDVIIFYDSFGIDNRGLTHQYINAIASTKKNFIYILNSESNSDRNLIINQLNSLPNAKIIIIDPGLSYISKINFINKVILDSKASYSFLQMTPWDVVGVVCWTLNSNLKRFQINLTDHAYWLGRNCFDFIIEFRGFGASLSNRFRQIPAEKIHMLNYYPITNSEPFAGFPITVSKKKVIVSGGSYFKIYGEKDIYFQILKRLFQENEDIVLFFAGSGDKRKFEKFIIQNNYQEKIFLIGSRSDISEVISRCDVFLSTYPINGGLMCQLAVANGKVPIVYSDKKLPFNFINLFFKNNLKYNLDYSDLNEFHFELNRLINDITYRRNVEKTLHGIIPTVDEFNSNFKKLVEMNISNLDNNYNFIKFDLDIKSFHELHVETENNYLKSYSIQKLHKIYKFYFKYNLVDFIKCSIELLLFKSEFIFNKFSSYVRIQKK